MYPFRRHSRKTRRLYHFQLCFAPLRRRLPPRKQSHALDGVIACSKSHYGVFLYPDGKLMAAYWYYAIILAAGITVGFQKNLSVLAISLASYLLLFFFVNHLLLRRNPAFGKKLQQAVPTRILPWLLNKVSRIDLSHKDVVELSTSRARNDHFIRIWLGIPLLSGKPSLKLTMRSLSHVFRPRLRTRRRHRYVEARNQTEQILLLRSAIANFFHAHKHPDNLGMWRFLLFWCAPAWIAYFSLLIPLLMAFAIETPPDYVKGIPQLVIPITLWLMGTMYFIYLLYRHLREYDFEFCYLDLGGYPAATHELLKDGAFLNSVVGKPALAKILSGVSSVLYVAYIALLSLYVSSNPPPH